MFSTVFVSEKSIAQMSINVIVLLIICSPVFSFNKQNCWWNAKKNLKSFCNSQKYQPFCELQNQYPKNYLQSGTFFENLYRLFIFEGHLFILTRWSVVMWSTMEYACQESANDCFQWRSIEILFEQCIIIVDYVLLFWIRSFDIKNERHNNNMKQSSGIALLHYTVPFVCGPMITVRSKVSNVLKKIIMA